MVFCNTSRTGRPVLVKKCCGCSEDQYFVKTRKCRLGPHLASSRVLSCLPLGHSKRPRPFPRPPPWNPKTNKNDPKSLMFRFDTYIYIYIYSVCVYVWIYFCAFFASLILLYNPRCLLHVSFFSTTKNSHKSLSPSFFLRRDY